MIDIILVINSGSSSIKFSIFESDLELKLLYRGQINICESASDFQVNNSNEETVLKQTIISTKYEILFSTILNWIDKLPKEYALLAVGHRVVHGGKIFTSPVFITAQIIDQLESLVPLAPLHQGHNLNAIKIINKLYPDVLQIASFDTTFHLTMNKLAKQYAIPTYLTEDGIVKYGFHGISYEYIASKLTQYIGDAADKKVIVAHLGSGASLCAMFNKKSITTTMGFSTLDGLVMNTRPGNIDAGILLYLIQFKQFSFSQLESLLYKESGLLGISGISKNMKELVASNDPKAINAVELFCYRVAMEIGSLCMALSGCDSIIFTAGIGENIPVIRQKICEYLKWLNAEIDKTANDKNSPLISTKDSKIKIGIIPTNEEYMIAKHVLSLLAK